MKITTWTFVLLVVGALTAGAQQLPVLGSEFQVNTYTTADQNRPAVAIDGSGRTVVVWESAYQDGDEDGIFGQRYASDGSAVGSEFQVNTFTVSRQRSPSVAPEFDGDFVVVWQEWQTDGSYDGIFQQRFSSDGSRLGLQYQVNSYTTSDQYGATVDVVDSGAFVVAWTSYGQDGDRGGVFARRFASDGSPRGAEFQVNTWTIDHQSAPHVVTYPDQAFTIAWQSGYQDGEGQGVFAQRYTSDGSRLGSEFQVNTFTTSDQWNPRLAVDDSGALVAVWSGYGRDGSVEGVFARRFTSQGFPLGVEFQVNSYTTASQYAAGVAATASGDFVITWASRYQDGDGAGIFGRHFASDGAALGAEFQVNTFTTYDQFDPAIAASGDGLFTVVWTGHQRDGSGDGVFGQRLGQEPSLPALIFTDGFEQGVVYFWSDAVP